MGQAKAKPDLRPLPEDLNQVDESAVRCFESEAEQAMTAEVKAAAKVGDFLGGVADACLRRPRRPQAIKAVEVGGGVENAARRGSEAHDAIAWDEGDHAHRRESDRAGGIKGGMTTGGLLVARAYMEPLATLNRPVLKTVNVETKEEGVSFKERTDCHRCAGDGRLRRDDGCPREQPASRGRCLGGVRVLVLAFVLGLTSG